ncbi:unnamed protein product [Parnassius apollo]|uniref:(apollo) hypothetical protein n=1 Tax=Parnassius apollo TaxID=110799 RepID=A0A8S3X0V0_PARAO|nr:unnamed protein product [Parnassius apollo]
MIGLRKALYKCDICGRRLMSAKSLKHHQDLAHKERGKRKYASNKGAVKKKKNACRAKIVFGKVKLSGRKKNICSRREADTKATVKDGSAAILSNPVDVSNVEYECPICMKIFPAYFSASMHIQKNHCTQVKYVAKSKANTRKFKDMLEPLLKEICMKCNQRISATESHQCFDTVEDEEMKSNMSYKCSGCNQQFISLLLFDLHITKLHSNGVETMFIPNVDEFLAWKGGVEKKTKVKYALLEKYRSKEIYHCTFSPHDGNFYDDNTIYCCPATISVQKFSEGLQVRFYKEHYGHVCELYVIAEKYKKYSLTSLLQNTDVYAAIDKPNVNKKDLYFQFQRLMESIVVNAGKLNVEALKLLYGRALAMTTVLKNYIEDTDLSSSFMDKVIENNIIWELGNLGNNQGKENNTLLFPNESTNPSILRQFGSPSCKQTDQSMPSPQNVMLMSVFNDPNIISRCFNTPHKLADQDEPIPKNLILTSMLNAPNKFNECLNLTQPVMSKTQSELNSKIELNMGKILNSSTLETSSNMTSTVNTKEIGYVRAPVSQNPSNMSVVVCKEFGKDMYVQALPLNVPPVVAGKDIIYVPAAPLLNTSNAAAGVAGREIRQNITSSVVNAKNIGQVASPLPPNSQMAASSKRIGQVSESEPSKVKEKKLGPASFSDTYKDFVSKYFYKCPRSTSNKRT